MRIQGTDRRTSFGNADSTAASPVENEGNPGKVFQARTNISWRLGVRTKVVVLALCTALGGTAGAEVVVSRNPQTNGPATSTPRSRPIPSTVHQDLAQLFERAGTSPFEFPTHYVIGTPDDRRRLASVPSTFSNFGLGRGHRQIHHLSTFSHTAVKDIYGGQSAYDANADSMDRWNSRFGLSSGLESTWDIGSLPSFQSTQALELFQPIEPIRPTRPTSLSASGVESSPGVRGYENLDSIWDDPEYYSGEVPKMSMAMLAFWVGLGLAVLTVFVHAVDWVISD